MINNQLVRLGVPTLLLALMSLPAAAQSFRVQCPTSTITHPSSLTDVNAEPAYTAPTTLTAGPTGYLVPSANVNGAIKCQQISGGDGFATMGDGTQTYMFSFGPLSGLTDIASGLPGTESPARLQHHGDGHAGTRRSGHDRRRGSEHLAHRRHRLSSGDDGRYHPELQRRRGSDHGHPEHRQHLRHQRGWNHGNGDRQCAPGRGGRRHGEHQRDWTPPATTATFTVTAINVPNPFFAANFAFTYTNSDYRSCRSDRVDNALPLALPRDSTATSIRARSWMSA